MASPVLDQEFVVHLFALEDGPQADHAYQQLRRLWTACRERLGMSGPIAEIDVADQLPERRDRLPSGGVLAAQERVGSKDRQCVLRRVGGLLNASVMFARPRSEGSSRGGLRRGSAVRSRQAELGWAEFSQLWMQARDGGTDAMLGEATVLLARTSTRRNSSITATRLGEALARLLPYDETRPNDWWRHGIVTQHGFGVWDTHPAQAVGVRELIVVAPSDADATLSAWVWSNGTAALPPLAEYLLHAAVLRYHEQVLERWQSTPRPPDLDTLIAEIAAAFEISSSTGDPYQQDRIRLLELHLTRLKATELRLGTLRERLQRVADGARAALRQMTMAWDETTGTESGAGLADDQALGNWLIDQASAELAYQRIRLDRTASARTLVAEELDRYSRPRAQPSMSGDERTEVLTRSAASAHNDVSRNVFVIYGRDDELKKIIFSFLQALGLRPQDWESLVNATGGTSPTLMDVVRRAPEIAQATLVLMTPDDVVQLHPDLAGPDDPEYETARGCQARPNVILELGMALMAYPEHTIVIEIGQHRPISDLGGLNAIRFDGLGPSIDKVIKRLRQAGCPVDDSDTSWRDPSRFAGLRAYSRTHRYVNGQHDTT